MNKNRILLYTLCCLCLPLWGQGTAELIRQNPDLAGGIYFAYPGPTRPMTPAPKDYEPFYLSHYGRHGSRYLIADQDYKGIIDLFDDAHAQQALTAQGESVRERLHLIWKDAEGHGGDLSSLGVKQQRGIGERMFRNYPQIFAGNPQMTARSTTSVRCVLSMDALCERLKELNPSLQLTRESSNKYMNYLNYHTSRSNQYTSHNGSAYLQYQKYETAHTHGERMAHALFSDATFLRKKVDYNKLLWGLYWIAVDLQDVELDGMRIYDIFETQELIDLWSIYNYKNYMIDGPSPQSEGLLRGNGGHLLQNILDSADEAIQAGMNTATLRFGHDGNIIPLCALMRLEGCDGETLDDEKVMDVWKNFTMAPMGGNIQLVFFRHKKNKEDVLVKFLLNENEVHIPLATDKFPFYNWNDARTFFQQQIDLYNYDE